MSTSSKRRHRVLTMFVQSIEFSPKEIGLDERIDEIDIELNERQIIQLREALRDGNRMAQIGTWRIRLKGKIIL